jgi:hypothetical protein
MPIKEEINAKIKAYSAEFAKKVEAEGKPLSLVSRFKLNLEFYDFMNATNNGNGKTLTDEEKKTESEKDKEAREGIMLSGLGYSEKIALQAYSKARCDEEIIKNLGQNIAKNDLMAFRSCIGAAGTVEKLPKITTKELATTQAATIAHEFVAFYDKEVASKIESLLDKYNPIRDCPLKELIELHKFVYEGFLGKNDDKYQIAGVITKSAAQILAEGLCKAKLQEGLGLNLSTNLTKLASRHPDMVPAMESLYKKYPKELETQLNEVYQYFDANFGRQIDALKKKYPGGIPLAEQLQLSDQLRTGFINPQKGNIGVDPKKPDPKKDPLFALVKSLAIKEVTRLTGVYYDETFIKVASELSKACFEQQKGKAIPQKHSDAITKLLASPAGKDFVERYSSDEKFRKTIDARMPKSDDISGNAAKLKYLQIMIETPDLFQRICTVVERANGKLPKEIDTDFVKKFNGAYDVRVEPFTEAVKDRYLKAQNRGLFSSLKKEEAAMIEEELQPIILEADKLGISLSDIALMTSTIPTIADAIQRKDNTYKQSILEDLRKNADTIRNFGTVSQILAQNKAFSKMTPQERVSFYKTVVEPSFNKNVEKGKLLGSLLEGEDIPAASTEAREAQFDRIGQFMSLFSTHDITTKFLHSDAFKKQLNAYMNGDPLAFSLVDAIRKSGFRTEKPEDMLQFYNDAFNKLKETHLGDEERAVATKLFVEYAKACAFNKDGSKNKEGYDRVMFSKQINVKSYRKDVVNHMLEYPTMYRILEASIRAQNPKAAVNVDKDEFNHYMKHSMDAFVEMTKPNSKVFNAALSLSPDSRVALAKRLGDPKVVPLKGLKDYAMNGKGDVSASIAIKQEMQKQMALEDRAMKTSKSRQPVSKKLSPEDLKKEIGRALRYAPTKANGQFF